MASIVMGIAGGIVCQYAVSLKPRFGYDDALDVVGVHMVGGTLGALLTGVFATKAVNSAVPTLSLGLDGGLLYGHPGMVMKQFIAVAATYIFCGVGNLIILVIVNAITPLRPTADDESIGLDLSQHSEQAYTA
jgi:Amt family ammonium transporter